MACQRPGAAASLWEGLFEIFTVTRLGVTRTLAKTLTTSNPIEFDDLGRPTTNRNVTRWRDGQMVLRWTAAGMRNAQLTFRRVEGHKQMPQFVAALYRHAHPNSGKPSVPRPKTADGSSPKFYSGHPRRRWRHRLVT